MVKDKLISMMTKNAVQPYIKTWVKSHVLQGKYTISMLLKLCSLLSKYCVSACVCVYVFFFTKYKFV